MDKSRNNEYSRREAKQALIAIGKTSNIPDKNKSLYIRRSIYSRKFSDYPNDKVDKPEMKNNNSDRKYHCLKFDNFTLVKSQSSINIPSAQKSVLPPLKLKNSSPTIQPYKCSQDSKPLIHDFFLNSKLIDKSKNIRNKNTNFKFSLYIDNLLSKKVKEKKNSKVNSFHDGVYENSNEQRILCYNQELNTKYKDILRNMICNVDFCKKNNGKPISSRVKICFFEELMNLISRKISIYNQNNQLIQDVDVVNLINDEIEKYFSKNHITLGKKRESFVVNDFEIDPKKMFPPTSLISNYNDIIHHKQYIQNKLIKKELNKSEDSRDFKCNRKIHSVYNKDSWVEIIRSGEGRLQPYIIPPVINNKDQHQYLNRNNEIHTINEHISLSTSPHFSKRNKNNVDTNIKDDKPTECNGKEPKEDFASTMQSFNKLHPKNLNNYQANNNNERRLIESTLNVLNEKDINDTIQYSNESDLSIRKKVLQMKEARNLSIEKQRKKFRKLQVFRRDNRNSNTKINKESNDKTILRTSQKNSTLTKRTIENVNDKTSYYNRSSILTIDDKKQKEFEELENQRLKKEEEELKKQREAEIIKEERDILRKERAIKQEEEYKKYVQSKQLKEINTNKSENKIKIEADQPDKKEPKLGYFQSCNIANQQCLLQSLKLLKPKKQLKKSKTMRNSKTIFPEDVPQGKLHKKYIPSAFNIKYKHTEQLVMKKHSPTTSYQDESPEISVMKKQSFTGNNQEESREKVIIKKQSSRTNHQRDLTNSKRKRQLIFLKVRKDIDFLYTKNNNTNVKEDKHIDELEEKFESLRRFTSNLDDNFFKCDIDKIQEEIDTLHQAKEDEHRINAFIKDLDLSLDKTREKKEYLHSQFQLVDCQFTSSSLSPIHTKYHKKGIETMDSIYK